MSNIFYTTREALVMSHGAILLLATLVGLSAYLAAPPLAALALQHPERGLIYKLTPLTLLSFILWFVLLAWALSGRRDDAIISRYVAKLRSNNHLPIAVTLIVIAGAVGGLITQLI